MEVVIKVIRSFKYRKMFLYITCQLGCRNSTEANDEKKGNKSYIIKVVAEDYINTERFIYLAKVNKGEVSTANVDTNLSDGATQNTKPEE